MKLIPFLGFNGNAHDAMAFYAQALGGKVTSEMKYRDMPPSPDMDMEGCGPMAPDTLDHVAHCQLEAGGAILMARPMAPKRSRKAAIPPSMSMWKRWRKPSACSGHWPRVAR